MEKLIKLTRTKYCKRALIFSILVISSIYLSPTLFSTNQTQDTALIDDHTKTEFNDETPLIPRLSVFGEAPWWDNSFEYRMLINVSNPYSYNFQDFGVSVSFNYNELVQTGKMQSDLDDIRIVENGILRKYYVVKDYPSVNYATVFFNTNVSQNTYELDTYMYFGNIGAANNEADDPSDSFGWVKNGNFELDYSSDTKFVPYGWTFSHNPVDTIKGKSNPSPNPFNSSATSYEYFENRLIDNPTGAERVAQGEYAYKWGAKNDILGDPAVHDYAGTLFSYPFTVPIVEGGDIFLRVYRNIRTYRFERPKNVNPDTIHKDGYFIRILNGSSSHYDLNPDNHNDADISPTFQNYAESYDGDAYYNVPARKWDDPTKLFDFPDHSSTVDTVSDSIGGGADGDLTGYIYINLTSYMGKQIFFEIGVWGDESDQTYKEKSAFFEVDDIGFDYTLSSSIHEVQARKSELTITARDVDGRIVPNAEIFLLNESAKGTPDYVVDSGYTSVLSGSITFSDLLNGEYNVTANYTLGAREELVGNTVKILNGTSYSYDLTLNLWTIDFEVIDWEGIPLSYGYIEVNESYGGALLDTLTLDSNGKATFRWLNTTEYYFRVYYENEDYSNSPFLLNESYITRKEYNNVKAQTHVDLVDNLNVAPPTAEKYSVQETYYTGGSKTDFGNKKIIKANITLASMNDQLVNVSIYYIDKNNSTGTGTENLLYFENGYGFNEDNDFIEIDIPKVQNSKLQSEKFEVYGLYIEIHGVNDTACNGVITVDLIETCNVLNRTHLSRLNIRVININELFPAGAPVDAVVKVFDNQTGQSITNLISDSGRNGYSFGQINDIPFWFFKDRVYNFSINIVNITNADFNVTLLSPDNQWKPTDNAGVQFYNYTLLGAAAITFNIIFTQQLNITSYDTAFSNSSGTLEAFWGEDLTYSAIFQYTVNNGNTWQPITNPSATCTLYIREVGAIIDLKTKTMGAGSGLGNFTITFSSNELSAGGTFKLYSIRIEGLYPGYPEPNAVNFIVKVKSVPTDMSAHDHVTRAEITDGTFTAHFNELLSVSMKYYIERSSIPLEYATLTYRWIGLAPIEIELDTLDSSYFTFTINTSDALSTGLKIISITASYENYSTLSNFLIYINILEREAEINGENELLILPRQVDVTDREYFVFTYTDANTHEILGDLTVASYVWYQVYENRSIIPGRSGSGFLTQNMNYTYTLDFKTKLKPIGFYLLYVTLHKENYEIKSALVDLKIVLREFNAEVDIENTAGTQVNVVQGEDVNIEIRLIDSSTGGDPPPPLENAMVYLSIGESNYNFDETSPGMYSLVFDTENIEAFFAPKLLAGVIYITKDNYTTQQVGVNINVQMEELFPGMPTFYFILIAAAIVGVVGAVVTYRVVQQARIPKFVKKIRKVKGLIKSKKPISEAITTRTKEEMMVKLYGDDWRELELSLEQTLGIINSKLKPSPLKEVKEEFGGERD